MMRLRVINTLPRHLQHDECKKFEGLAKPVITTSQPPKSLKRTMATEIGSSYNSRKRNMAVNVLPSPRLCPTRAKLKIFYEV